MRFNDLKIQLKDLIQKGQIDIVFTKINEFIDKDDKDVSELYNDFILISSQYKNLWRNKLILSNEELNINQNKIYNSLIIFIDKLAEIEYLKDSQQNKPSINYPSVFIDFNSEINKVKTEMIGTNNQVISFYQTLINLKNEIDKIERNTKLELTKKQEQVKELNIKKEKLERQIIEKEREYENLKTKFDELAKSKTDIEDLNKRYDIAKEEIIRLKGLNDLLSNKYDDLTEQNKTLTSNLNAKELEYVKTKANLQVLEERFSWDAKVVDNLKNELSKKDKTEIDIYDYKNQVNLLNQKVEFLNNQLKSNGWFKYLCVGLGIIILVLITIIVYK
jgi:chromosome segregation ATPase